MFCSETQAILVMQLVKRLVNQLARLVISRIYVRYDDRYLCLSARFEQNFYQMFRSYLDKTLRLPDKEILGD